MVGASVSQAKGTHMANDLVPQDGLPVKFDRQTNRQMAELRRQALAQQMQTGSAETNAAFKVDTRIRNAYDLAHRTVQNAVNLNHEITQAARGNAELEAALKIELEQPILRAAGYLITGYVIRA